MNTFKEISSILPASKVSLCTLSRYWMILSPLDFPKNLHKWNKTSRKNRGLFQNNFQQTFSHSPLCPVEKSFLSRSPCLLEIYFSFFFSLADNMFSKKEKKEKKTLKFVAVGIIFSSVSESGLLIAAFEEPCKTVIWFAAVVALMNCAQLMPGTRCLSFMKSTENTSNALSNVTLKRI